MTRRATWMAGVAAIMPVAALNAPVIPASAASSSQFQPPLEPMVLTRILRRPLPGGAEVMTRRSYEIRFVRDGDGYRIEGRLVQSEIEVPSPYESLAALERSRPDDSLFPLRLDASGRLLPNSGQEDSAAADKARAMAMGRVAGFNLSADETRQARAFVGQLQASPGRTAWPEDLFRPAPGRHRQTKDIPLPDGTQGHVSIDIDAVIAGPAGLLSTLDRTVTTDIGGDARVAHETWTLVQAG